VLIEAMAAGRPYVSTDVGGVRDLALGAMQELPNGMGHRAANGFLTSRTPEALLYCIEQIGDNPQIGIEMASVGRSFALDRFSVERLVEGMSSLYQTLLTGRLQVASESLQNSAKSVSGTEDRT
jgi:glycosyltransferase involved in cell wall biosynthesis